MTPKTVLITGASRGIGLAVAGHLHHDGHSVIAACRNPSTAAELVDLGVAVVTLDTTSQESLDGLATQVAEHTDRLDVLVNNAGVKQAAGHVWEASSGPLTQLDADAVNAVLATNVIGSMMMTRAVLGLLAQPGGVVVNVSSQLSSFEIGLGVDYAYNCSKAALNMMTVTMQRDIGQLGIIPVSLNPGWMKTAMGGAEAPLEIDDATRDIASLVVRLDASYAGRFVDRSGTPVPW